MCKGGIFCLTIPQNIAEILLNPWSDRGSITFFSMSALANLCAKFCSTSSSSQYWSPLVQHQQKNVFYQVSTQQYCEVLAIPYPPIKFVLLSEMFTTKEQVKVSQILSMFLLLVLSTHSGRKVTREEREKNSVNSGHYVLPAMPKGSIRTLLGEINVIRKQ